MEKAFKVWWYIGWRTGLVLLALKYFFIALANFDINLFGLEGVLSLIISVLIGVLFVKMAINRDYGSFRVAIIDKE